MKLHRYSAVIASLCLLFSTGCDKESGNSSEDTDLTGTPVVLELPTDPQPENTSFPHRILLIQHTGTACPNCPGRHLHSLHPRGNRQC